MKSRNASTNARVEQGSFFDQASLKKRRTHRPEEIRKRAFEIHIEHGGISWLRPGRLATERELNEKFEQSYDEARKSK